MKRLVFSALLACFCIIGFSQYTPIDVRFYGGSSFEVINCLYPLENGDFIFAGSSRSSDGDLETNNGNDDCWFVHLDSDLNIIKSVSFGESESESIRDVIPLSDTSFLFLISSNSNTGIFSNSNGSSDAWIRTHYYPDWFSPGFAYGGSSADRLNNIIPKSIGEGYLAFGNSYSNDGHLSGNFGNSDFWVINLTNTLDVAWSKNYGGSGHETAIKGFQLESGNLLVFGNTLSEDIMVHDHKGILDVWVVKLNSMGDTIWTKSFGGSGYDEVFNVIQIDTDLFAMTGYSYSIDGDFLFMKNSKISNGFGFYYIINSDGDFQAGGSLMLPHNDLRYMDLIFNSPDDITVLGLHDTNPDELLSNYDVVISNFDAIGIESNHFFGGNSDEYGDFLKAVKISDTDLLIGVASYSDDLAPVHHGSADIMLAILRNETTGINGSDFQIINIFPNPSTSEIFIKGFNAKGELHYKIFNISGKLLKEDVLNENMSINISDLPNGTYILSTSDGKKTLAGKFSISK